jgi:transcriptional regulator with XRE-family HTH domain
MTPAERFAAWLGPAMRRAGLDIDKPQGGGRAVLATACNVSRSTVTRWLEGRSMPGPDQFQPIAEALNVPVIEMLIGSGVIAPESVGEPRTTYPTPEEAAEELGISPDDRELFVGFVRQLQKRAERQP